MQTSATSRSWATSTMPMPVICSSGTCLPRTWGPKHPASQLDHGTSLQHLNGPAHHPHHGEKQADSRLVPTFFGMTCNGFGAPSNMNGLAFSGNAVSDSATLIGGGGIAHSSNTAPVQVDPFCHLDLANFLPADTIKTIRSRGYVDFAKLLPANMEDPVTETNTQQVTSTSRVCVQATTKNQSKQLK